MESESFAEQEVSREAIYENLMHVSFCAKKGEDEMLAFDITKDFLRELYELQGGCCSLTGIPFVFERPARGRKNNPFSVSLDRIDVDGGYVKGNVRFVLTVVNFALSEFGEDVFRRVVNAYVGKV